MTLMGSKPKKTANVLYIGEARKAFSKVRMEGWEGGWGQEHPCTIEQILFKNLTTDPQILTLRSKEKRGALLA